MRWWGPGVLEYRYGVQSGDAKVGDWQCDDPAVEWWAGSLASASLSFPIVRWIHHRASSQGCVLSREGIQGVREQLQPMTQELCRGRHPPLEEGLSGMDGGQGVITAQPRTSP